MGVRAEQAASDTLGRAARPSTEQRAPAMTKIRNTDADTTKPWPQGLFIQGGKHGVVLVRGGQNYRTAFVEVFPAGTFIRGEGETIAAAEQSAWEKYQAGLGCEHEYEPRSHTNGGGFCKSCGQFGSNVFTGEQLGQFCEVCGVGTTWAHWSPAAYWDDARGFPGPVDPDPAAAQWFCAGHAPFASQYADRVRAMDDELAEPFTVADIEDVLKELGPG